MTDEIIEMMREALPTVFPGPKLDELTGVAGDGQQREVCHRSMPSHTAGNEASPVPAALRRLPMTRRKPAK
jgi:hypothetical protein